MSKSPVSTNGTSEALRELATALAAVATIAFVVDAFSNGGVIRAIGRRLYPIDEELLTEPDIDVSGVVAEATRITREEVTR